MEGQEWWAMCCLQKTSAGMQLGYKSVLFILHFHLAGMNRGEPGRTVAPPWRTGKNRSVNGGSAGMDLGEPWRTGPRTGVNRVSAGMNRGPAGALPGWTGVPRGVPGSWGPRWATVEIFRQKNVIFTRYIPVHEPGWPGRLRDKP